MGNFLVDPTSDGFISQLTKDRRPFREFILFLPFHRWLTLLLTFHRGFGK